MWPFSLLLFVILVDSIDATSYRSRHGSDQKRVENKQYRCRHLHKHLWSALYPRGCAHRRSGQAMGREAHRHGRGDDHFPWNDADGNGGRVPSRAHGQNLRIGGDTGGNGCILGRGSDDCTRIGHDVRLDHHEYCQCGRRNHRAVGCWRLCRLQFRLAGESSSPLPVSRYSALS